MSTAEETQELPPGITWQHVREALKRMAKDGENWAGCPLPISGVNLVIEPRYPNQGLNGFSLPREKDEEYDAHLAATYDNEEKAHLVKYDRFKERYLGIQVGDDGKLRIAWQLPTPQAKTHTALRFVMDTMLAAQAWDYNAEMKAQEKLLSLVSDHQFSQYQVTGMFVERSPRSQVLYVFRRLRPTLALRYGGDFRIRVLAGLCMHPVGYYEKTFAGCLVPTDDVIAHLLMVRGAEHKFWALANHHAPEECLGY